MVYRGHDGVRQVWRDYRGGVSQSVEFVGDRGARPRRFRSCAWVVSESPDGPAEWRWRAEFAQHVVNPRRADRLFARLPQPRRGPRSRRAIGVAPRTTASDEKRIRLLDATAAKERPRREEELLHRGSLLDGEDRHLVALDRGRFAGPITSARMRAASASLALIASALSQRDMTTIAPLSRSTKNTVPFMPSVCPYSVGSTFFFVSSASLIASGEAPS